MQNTKIRAAAFTCCLLFPQKRARDFRGLAQTPSAISRCLRATSFPRHFAADFYFSNIPFFLFSFFYHFSLFLFFFLFSALFLFLFFLLFIFSLHFLFSRLFLSSFLFSFSYPLFPFSFFLFLSPCTFFVCTIPKAAKQNVVL